MNTIYRIVWNTVSCRWVVASELAKGRKKKGTKHHLAAVSGAIGILVASPLAMAGPGSGFSAGILGSGTGSCLSTAAAGVNTAGATCDTAGGATQAGIVSYTSTGAWGAYLTVTDPNTVRLGAGGSDKLQILSSGIKALATMDMGNNITNLANGGISSGSSDAVNGGQIFNISQSVWASSRRRA